MKQFLILSLVLFWGCQSSEKTENTSLKDEVMAIHDEVMPKMGELRRTRMELVKLADSLMVIDSLHASTYMDLANEIGEASEGMMQWMRNYEPDFEGTKEEIEAYLNEQKEAIQLVKDEMEGSLSRGKEALERE